MADDGQIRIGLAIDTSALSGAQGQAEANAAAIAAAYDKVAAASLNVQNVQSRHKDILKQYQTGAIDAAESTKLLSQNLTENTAATLELSNTKRTLAAIINEEGPALRSNANAALEDAAAQEEDTAATVRGISARQSATASIGILEGRTLSGNRAAAAFLSTTLGLGPALQAAFPVIGAIALIDVLAQVIQAVGKFSSEAQELGTELGSGWLDGAIAQLTGLGKEIEQVDERLLKLAQDRDRLTSESRAADVDKVRITQGEAPADRLRASQIQAQIDALEKLKNVQLQDADALGKKADDLAAHLHAEEGTRISSAGTTNIEAIRRQQDAARAAFDETVAQQQTLQKQKENLYLEAEKEDSDKNKPGGHIAAPNYSDALAAQEESEGKSLGATVLYWENVVATTGKYHAQLLRAEEDFQKHLAEKSKIKEEVSKAERIGPEPHPIVDTAELAGTKESEEQADRRINDAIEKQIALKQRAYEQDVRDIEFRQRIGQISPRKAEQEQLAASKTAQQAEVEPLQQRQKQIAPLGPVGLDDKQATEYQSLQNKITEIQQQASDKRAQIVEQETIREVAAYQHAMQQMDSAIVGGINTWLTTHKKFSDAMIDAGEKIAVDFIDDILQMGLKWASNELLMTALHVAGITQRQTADASGAAASASIKAAQAATTIATNSTIATSEAGVAAATAAAEAAPAGPEAAVAAGAAMLAAMTPFIAAASLDTGGVVPGRAGQPVPILAHGGEEVVQGPIAAMVAKAGANGGSLGGGGHTFVSHYSPQISVLDGKGIEAYTSRAGAHMSREMMRRARQSNSTM